MRIIFALTAILTVFTVNAAGVNLIKNGDFSQGFKHWYRVGKPEISKTVKAGDKNSICIRHRNHVVQKVALEPNAVYELTFLAKGENIPTANPAQHGGRIILHGGKRYGRATPNADGSCMTGTFDWKRARYRFNSSRFNNAKRLDIYLQLTAEGKLYLTDIKLVKIGMEKIEVSKPGNKFFRESYLKNYPLPDLYPTDQAYGFIEPGTPAKFKFEMQKLEGLEYTLNVKNELGKTVFTQKRKPYETGEIITIPGQERGYYILEANAFIKDKKIAMVQSAFVSTPAMKGKRDPFFRVNQFCIWTPLIHGYRMIGAGSVTLPIIGGEKGDPAKNASKRFLGTYKRFLDSDFELHALYVGGMSQRNCNMDMFRRGYPMYTEEYLKSIESCVTEAAKILKGKVKSYGTIMEIPSHAQMKHKHAGTWVEAMSQQLFRTRIVSRAARKIDPGAKISAGGNNVQMYIDPIERIVMSDLVDDFDVYNIDAYFGSWNLTSGKPNIPERSLRDFYIRSSDLARSLGKTPMVENTETGYMIHYGDRFDKGLAVTQAYLTARAIVISKSAPVSCVALFRLSTHYGFDENKPMSGSFPTVWKPGRAADNRTLTYTPLPGGAAFAAFARELAFVKFVKEIKTADKLLYAYVFKRPDGKSVLSAWTIENDYTIDLQLEKPALMVSMYGRESKLNAGKQSLKLTVEPFYLVLDEPAEKVADKLENIFKAIRPLYKSAAKLTALDQAVLYVNNSGDDKITVKSGSQTMDILPGTIGEMAVKIRKGQKNIEFTVNGEKFNTTVIDNTVRFKKHNNGVKLDKNGNFPAGTATGKLVVPTHVKPVSALHPELSYFKNPLNPDGHDISAEYSLTYDDKNIYLTVKVDDPTHIQRFRKTSIWQGDNVQFVFANTPGPSEDVRTLGAKANIQGHNYSAALTPRGPEVVKYHTQLATRVKANVYRKNNHTIYEIVVPKSEINCVPGKPLYFNFVVFDNNSKTANMAPYWLDMDKGLAGGRDNALLPLVIFE